MEIIRIPQVSLVDATGRRIGVYTDDPDWWQQLKLKHHNTAMQHQQPAVTAQQSQLALPPVTMSSLPPPRQLTPVDLIENESSFGSRTKLVREDTEINKKQDMRMALLKKEMLNRVSSVEQIGNSTNNNNWQSNYEDNQKQCNVIGETPLHIAIMFDDFATIKFLIEKKGFNVNQRCVGGKFSGGFNSKLTANLIQQSKYEGLAYYGEYPLAFAACFANKEIYDYLIDKGADPNLQDTYGNTVLHVLVINNKIDMFQYATNHQKKKALLTIKNSQDLTPINLAAKLGRKDLFSKMLELRNIEFWRYSNITCSAYPLDGLDTVDADGKIAWNAALSYIVNGDTEDHLDMLEIGVVKRLLEDKWSTYAQKRFFQRLFLSLIHLLFLTIAVYTRAGDNSNLLKWPPGSANTWVRYLSELVVIIGCIAVLFLQAQEIYAQGFKYYLKNLIGEPANVFYQIFCILILFAVPFRFVSFNNSGISARNVEDTLVILAIPCGWVHLLFYARVANVTGPFVVMIYKMIIGDILTFSSIYSLLLFGFSLGFYYLYKNGGSGVHAMDTYPEALMISFQMTLGEFKARLPEFDQIYYSDFTKVVFVAFMILMHILLLNMLIAMMGNTYHQIIKKSEKEWRRQWAHIVVLLERSFSPQDLKKFQNQYCIKLPSKDPNNKTETVALMVIKKAPKTKAFQKTTCVRNWKRFCKAVMLLLKENDLKSIELLESWENKDIKVIKNKKPKNSSGDTPISPTKIVRDTATKLMKTKPTPNIIKEVKKPDTVTKAKAPIKNNSTNNNTNNNNTNNNNNNTNSVSNNNNNTNNQNAPNEDPKQQLEHDSKFIVFNEQAESSASSRANSGAEGTTPSGINIDAANLSFFRHTHKKTFYPNQVSKIYPVMGSTFASVNNTNPDYYDPANIPRQINIQTNKNDNGRPYSTGFSRNTETVFAKNDIYPKFPQKTVVGLYSNDENLSYGSETGSFRQRTSPDGDESYEKGNESKI